jgi:hypothetical protein
MLNRQRSEPVAPTPRKFRDAFIHSWMVNKRVTVATVIRHLATLRQVLRFAHLERQRR